MKRLDDLIKKLEGLEKALNKALIEVLKENESVILDMNSEDQLYEQGINREGSSIMDYAPYSPLTIEIKKEKGQPYNRVTLRDEGNFEESFFIEWQRTGFEIKASDWKTQELKVKYGDEILGLTHENVDDLKENYIRPAIKKVFEKL